MKEGAVSCIKPVHATPHVECLRALKFAYPDEHHFTQAFHMISTCHIISRFGVFGYITKGLDDTVTKLGAGDRIVTARVTKGMEKLVNG